MVHSMSFLFEKSFLTSCSTPSSIFLARSYCHQRTTVIFISQEAGRHVSNTNSHHVSFFFCNLQEKPNSTTFRGNTWKPGFLPRLNSFCNSVNEQQANTSWSFQTTAPNTYCFFLCTGEIKILGHQTSSPTSVKILMSFVQCRHSLTTEIV